MGGGVGLGNDWSTPSVLHAGRGGVGWVGGGHCSACVWAVGPKEQHGRGGTPSAAGGGGRRCAIQTWGGGRAEVCLGPRSSGGQGQPVWPHRRTTIQYLCAPQAHHHAVPVCPPVTCHRKTQIDGAAMQYQYGGRRHAVPVCPASPARGRQRSMAAGSTAGAGPPTAQPAGELVPPAWRRRCPWGSTPAWSPPDPPGSRRPPGSQGLPRQRSARRRGGGRMPPPARQGGGGDPMSAHCASSSPAPPHPHPTP